MRTFRRKLVITPLLLAMALVALGLPASAQAVYEQNSSQACCTAQTCCATQSENAQDQSGGPECCPGGQFEEVPEGHAGAAMDQSVCYELCGTDCAQQACAPAHGSCPGSRSALGCCP